MWVESPSRLARPFDDTHVRSTTWVMSGPGSAEIATVCSLLGTVVWKHNARRDVAGRLTTKAQIGEDVKGTRKVSIVELWKSYH